MGQLHPRVWPSLPRAGQPHFNSGVNLRGHKCNLSFLFFFLIGAPETTMRLKLKERVHKHTCILFVILFDDKEGEYKKKPHRLGLDTDSTTWHHSEQVTAQSGDLKRLPYPGSLWRWTHGHAGSFLRGREMGKSNSSYPFGVYINNCPLSPQEEGEEDL